MSNGSAKLELEEAVELMESCVQHARQRARIYNTEVEMRLELNDVEQRYSIILSVPPMQQEYQLVDANEKFVFPAGVHLISDETIIRFESTGAVEIPTMVTLVSNQAEEINHFLMIE